MGGRTLRSDNNAGLCPEAVEAIVAANDGVHAHAYGDDPDTAGAESALRTIFGDDAAVFFVATGTAANTLAIASLVEPWQRVLCHEHSHFNRDESTAPERITLCRVTTIPTWEAGVLPATATSKLTPELIERLGDGARGDVHQPQPGVVTISNPTEFGEVYTPDETCAISECAHELGYRVHVDGARFANAVAHLGCDPRAIANEAGVDALSFGGTKNGLSYGEAVLFFPQQDGQAYTRACETFPFQRKATGHLLSKARYMTAPFARVLSDDTWLKHARHANDMAEELAQGLIQSGLVVPFARQSNAVFVQLEHAADRALPLAGHEYYFFGPRHWRLARLVCSFDTSSEDVAAFTRDAGAHREPAG